MIEGWNDSAHYVRKLGGYQDLHKTGLNAILMCFEMNLDQNSCLYQEKRVARKLLFLTF